MCLGPSTPTFGSSCPLDPPALCPLFHWLAKADIANRAIYKHLLHAGRWAASHYVLTSSPRDRNYCQILRS